MAPLCARGCDNATTRAAWRYLPRPAALRAASFVAAACLPSLAEAEFAAAPRHSLRWSPGWRHSWRWNPLAFVGSFRRCAGHRGSGLRTTNTNRPRMPIRVLALGWVQAFVPHAAVLARAGC